MTDSSKTETWRLLDAGPFSQVWVSAIDGDAYIVHRAWPWRWFASWTPRDVSRLSRLAGPVRGWEEAVGFCRENARAERLKRLQKERPPAPVARTTWDWITSEDGSLESWSPQDAFQYRVRRVGPAGHSFYAAERHVRGAGLDRPERLGTFPTLEEARTACERNHENVKSQPPPEHEVVEPPPGSNHFWRRLSDEAKVASILRRGAGEEAEEVGVLDLKTLDGPVPLDAAAQAVCDVLDRHDTR